MRIIIAVLLLHLCFFSAAQEKKVRIVFISDLHFGLKKAHFRNSKDSVSSEDVNMAMAKAIISLGKIDYIAITGDIANRQQIPLQSASVSWKQFLEVYEPLHIPMLITPGNHDLSNAIGYYKPMYPQMDKTGLVGMYNLIHNGQHLDTSGFVYNDSLFNYSRTIAGIHCEFISIWPDSANRAWMETDLKGVSSKTPVFVFAHDPPEGDIRHFKDPAAQRNPADTFENLLAETYTPRFEDEWDDFLKSHNNIKAYFHGHSNYQQFYTYKGVDSSLNLHCFRVDSPMKGKYSLADEHLLSFQLITIDPNKKTMEVKEYLWNKSGRSKWGERELLRL
jgi:hypothetical protein